MAVHGHVSEFWPMGCEKLWNVQLPDCAIKVQGHVLHFLFLPSPWLNEQQPSYTTVGKPHVEDGRENQSKELGSLIEATPTSWIIYAQIIA